MHMAGRWKYDLHRSLERTVNKPFTVDNWVNPHVLSLHPYVPGKQPGESNWVKLNTNELPYPPSPRVAEAIASEISRLPKYPSPTSAPLRRAIAEHHGLDPSQVIIGNGSDEILAMLFRAFAGPNRTGGETTPSYSLYPVLAAIQNTNLHSIPLSDDLSLPVEKIRDCPAPIFFLTTPNAPFGKGFGLEALSSAIDGFKGVFVADEAYADFGDSTAVTLLGRFPNLVVTRTFSKSYGLAGLRVGYALASAEIISMLDRLRDSYNLDRLSQAGALAAFQDQAYLSEVVAKVKTTRARFAAELASDGWEVVPSETNFVFARPPAAPGADRSAVAAAKFAQLEANKILVRYFPKSPRTADGLRITIGTDAEMDQCLRVLRNR